MKKIFIILIMLMLIPMTWAYTLTDICKLQSDPVKCVTLLSEQFSKASDLLTNYEYAEQYQSNSCSNYGQQYVLNQANNMCTQFSTSKVATLSKCKNILGTLYANKTVCMFDSTTQTYIIGDGKCQTNLGEPDSSSDCAYIKNGVFSNVKLDGSSTVEGGSRIHIVGNFQAKTTGVYLVENLPVTCQGKDCSLGSGLLLQTAAFTGTKSACKNDSYSDFFAGSLQYLDTGQTASISLYPQVPKTAGDYVYQLAAYTGCGGSLITKSDKILFTISGVSTTTTTTSNAVQTTLGGKFSSVNIPDSGIGGQQLVATATFTADATGQYLLELEPDSSQLGTSFFQETAVLTATDSACDGNVHWASKVVTLKAGETASLAFSPTLSSKEGTYKYRFTVNSGCSNEGGIALNTASDWQDVKVYSGDVAKAQSNGYTPECTIADDCGGGKICLNNYCVTVSNETSICTGGLPCGTDNEQIKAEENNKLLLFISGLIVVIVGALIIYHATKKKKRR